MKTPTLKRVGQSLEVLAGNIRIILTHRGDGVSIDVVDPKYVTTLQAFAYFSDEKDTDDDDAAPGHPKDR